MGSSRHYSSATDLPNTVGVYRPTANDLARDQKEIDSLDLGHDGSGATPIPTTDPTPELLLALARVDQSLRVVLLAIHEIQREMGISIYPTPDVPLKPDNS